jgi:hypothetical protein
MNKTHLLAILLLALATSVLVACGGEPGTGPYVDECSNAAGATRRPEVTITSPGNAEPFDSSDSINWVISVSDEDTALDDLEVELLDYSTAGYPETIDVTVPGADSDGRISFSIDASILASGQNPVRARATDPDGCFGEDDVLICIDQATCP